MVLEALKTNRARPFAIGLIATLFALAAAMTMGGGWASAQTGDDGTAPGNTTPTVEPEDTEPEGQLVRRGLFGKAVRVGGDSFLVETRQGNVLVLVNDETVIRKPPEGIVRFDALEVGDKVAVLLTKPTDEEAEDAPASDVFRTGTALKILIVPDRATRRHTRAVVLEKVRDRMRILNSDGEEVEVDADVEVDGEAGDEVLLITQDSPNSARVRVRAAARAEIIENRLERLAEVRSDVRDRIEQARDRVDEVRAQVRERFDAKLEDVEIEEEVRIRIEAKTDEIRTRVDARIKAERDKVDDMRDRVDERLEEAEDKAEEIRERADQARDRVRATAESRRNGTAEADNSGSDNEDEDEEEEDKEVEATAEAEVSVSVDAALK